MSAAHPTPRPVKATMIIVGVLVALTLAAVALVAVLLLREQHPPFYYTHPGHEALVFPYYPADDAALCPGESLRATIGIVIAEPTKLQVSYALRPYGLMGRTLATGDLNGLLGGPAGFIPYNVPRRYPAVPLTLPLPALAPGQYIFEAQADDGSGRRNGFQVVFEVKADEC